MARFVTVGSISARPTPPLSDKQARLQEAERLATRVARMGADIVVFPEVYLNLDAPIEDWPQLAEPASGPSTSYMAEVAKRHHMYVLWPLIQREGDYLYNSLLLIDRRGEVQGAYHKMFPTIGEIQAGVRPGVEATVLSTDFGKIGMAICFDLNFRPVMEGLHHNGAEIVFFSSMYRGGLQVQAWAQEFNYYIVTAIGAELGQIVDMSGRVLAESTYEAHNVLRLNLDRRVLHMDYNWDKTDDILAKYGTGVRFDFFTREAKFAIASEMPDRSVDEIITEFGLEPLDAYMLRAYQARDRALREGAS